MQIKLRFTKATGVGNDFVILDNRGGLLNGLERKIAVTLCDRHYGVGADGILLLHKSTRADFGMEYYNADGSHGGMCGNGGRCLAMYAYQQGVVGSSMRFEALDYIYRASVTEGKVRLFMKAPSGLREGIIVDVAGTGIQGDFIDTGAPHFVVLCKSLDGLDVTGVGRTLRHDPEFQPDGTNVDFVEVCGEQELSVRTYERGVEAETLACGTGSVAATVVARARRGVRTPVTVTVRSGESVLVDIPRSGDAGEDVWLEGKARMLFTGDCLFDSDTSRLALLPQS
jgi:diaminopimelate epimerase